MNIDKIRQRANVAKNSNTPVSISADELIALLDYAEAEARGSDEAAANMLNWYWKYKKLSKSIVAATNTEKVSEYHDNISNG